MDYSELDAPNPYFPLYKKLNELLEWEMERVASLFGSLEDPSDLDQGVLPWLGTAGLRSPDAVKRRSSLARLLDNKTPVDSVTQLESLYHCWGLVPHHVRT
jgi:hypothetical protein